MKNIIVNEALNPLDDMAKFTTSDFKVGDLVKIAAMKGMVSVEEIVGKYNFMGMIMNKGPSAKVKKYHTSAIKSIKPSGVR